MKDTHPIIDVWVVVIMVATTLIIGLSAVTHEVLQQTLHDKGVCMSTVHNNNRYYPCE